MYGGIRQCRLDRGAGMVRETSVFRLTLGHRATSRNQQTPLSLGQNAVRSSGERAQRETPDRDSHQLQNRQARRGQHPSDLTIPSFTEGDPEEHAVVRRSNHQHLARPSHLPAANMNTLA